MCQPLWGGFNWQLPKVAAWRVSTWQRWAILQCAVAYSHPKAAQWDADAVAGSSEAAHNLGLMLQHGDGCDVGDVGALRWFRLAAQRDTLNRACKQAR